MLDSSLSLTENQILLKILEKISLSLPAGQLKSLENSFILLSGPMTLKGPGEWTFVVIAIFIASVEKNIYVMD